MQTIKIASRTSKLALVQALIIKNTLIANNPDLKVEIIHIKTKGDKVLDKSLAKIGGKGLFVKELENLLLDNTADIAVHCMKDVPGELPPGLLINIMLPRATVNDALVSHQANSIEELPKKSVIGTSSLRRQTQLLQLRPDLICRNLRGNVTTRLEKLKNQEYDAIILAACGLERLGLEKHITEKLDTTVMLPAAGQGVLGIECRTDDLEVLELLKPLHDEDSYITVSAERQVTKILNGSCQAPIAAFAKLEQDNLKLEAKVLATDSNKIVSSCRTLPKDKFLELGTLVANELLDNGALDLIENAKKHFNN